MRSVEIAISCDWPGCFQEMRLRGADARKYSELEMSARVRGWTISRSIAKREEGLGPKGGRYRTRHRCPWHADKRLPGSKRGGRPRLSTMDARHGDSPGEHG